MKFFQYLAVQSPVFEALFFGNYAEKGKEEVEVKDVIYEVSLFFFILKCLLLGIRRPSSCDLR